MKMFNITALLLIVVGAINWGLWGFFHFDLVSWLFGHYTGLSRVIYGLVGISGIWGIGLFSKCSHICCKKEKK